MSTVNLKDEYRTETNEDVYAEENLYGGTGSYADDYVKWLEYKLNNNEVLDLVSGCFYWVKHTETCEYEPAIAECRYEKDVLYFCFTCGGAVKCNSVVDYKKLNNR